MLCSVGNLQRISIHAPREGSDRSVFASWHGVFFISIHAPREGSDVMQSDCDDKRNISIHAPREGSDLQISGLSPSGSEFQSTPPARGATLTAVFIIISQQYFNPRPPRGERRVRIDVDLSNGGISIHAPREGSDPCVLPCEHWHGDFNPRPPRGERRRGRGLRRQRERFQSTPPARGATSTAGRTTLSKTNFNPRPPRGERRS